MTTTADRGGVGVGVGVRGEYWGRRPHLRRLAIVFSANSSPSRLRTTLQRAVRSRPDGILVVQDLPHCSELRFLEKSRREKFIFDNLFRQNWVLFHNPWGSNAFELFYHPTSCNSYRSPFKVGSQSQA